jgi:GDP-L-fucose synthase
MEAARLHGVRKVVCLGSAASYPENARAPLREEDFWNGYPHQSRRAYAIAKKIPLVQAQAYRQQYGFNAIFLIPTNLYGPGDNCDPETSYVIPSLIRKFVAAAEADDPSVVLHGDPRATRDFLFVEDAADGILLALERYDGEEPVNLAAGEEVSIGTLAGMLAELAGFNGNVVWEPAERPGPAQRWLSTARAKREFGFRARTCLRDGLRATVKWYRQARPPDGHRNLAALGASRG